MKKYLYILITLLISLSVQAQLSEPIKTVNGNQSIVAPTGTVTSSTAGATWVATNTTGQGVWLGDVGFSAQSNGGDSYNITTGASLVKYTNEIWDSHSSYDPTTSIYTLPMDGKYLIIARIYCGTSGADTMSLALRVNNGDYAYDRVNTSIAAGFNLSITEVITGVKGQYVNVYVWSAGSTQTGYHYGGWSKFTIIKIK